MSILDFAPGPLRPEQRDYLLWFENNYNRYDVFVCEAPTAAGKSWMILTAARWLKSRQYATAILTPTKLLQDQYAAEFPDYPNLKGADNYTCVNNKRKSCEKVSHSNTTHHKCVSCPYVDIKRAAAADPIAVYNYWTYSFNRRPEKCHDHLILDEAHNATKIVGDLSTVQLRQSKVHFPSKLRTFEELIVWFESHLSELKQSISSASEADRPKIELAVRTRKRCLNDLRHHQQDFFYNIQDVPGARSDKLLQVLPLSLRALPPRLWGHKRIKKVLLFSATISLTDVFELGLDQGRRVRMFRCGSPIPARSRPFIYEPTADMSYSKRLANLPKLAQKIKELAEEFKKHKGIVHITYGLAAALRPLLHDDDRFIWHGKVDRDRQYKKFRESNEPKIFMASGFEEGIDLAYDAGRWQVIAALPFPNIKDAVVQARMGRDPEWYARHTARIIQQQAGRICRTPTDVGYTFILDNRFLTFYNTSVKFWPQWFNQAILWNRSMR